MENSMKIAIMRNSDNFIVNIMFYVVAISLFSIGIYCGGKMLDAVDPLVAFIWLCPSLVLTFSGTWLLFGNIITDFIVGHSDDDED